MVDNGAISQLLEAYKLAEAREGLLPFMRHCWWNTHPFREGRHTVAICNRLTKAVGDFRRGKSSYLIITVPYRHGKSDIVSRALPAWFLGACRDRNPDIIMTGYGADLVEDFSRRVMAIVQSERYQELFPLRLDKATAKKWSVEGSTGVVSATGIGGSITGKGGHLIIVDDYCKSREEAVSETKRNRVWDSFRNDIFTRQNSPACIVLVVATPWHTDDLIGRIEDAERTDDSFPRFERLSFPARKPGEYEYLFPELFAPEWYEAQRAVLGKQAAALLDCAPLLEGGERFDTSRVVFHDSLDGWPSLREVRAWDLASSTRECDGDDPDWTWGIRGGVRKIPVAQGLAKHEVWIRDMVCCREEAPKRNAIITATIQQDGPSIVQAIEGFGAYKDTYTTFRELTRGYCVTRRSKMEGDKSAKAAPLEAPFDAGIVHIYRPGCRGNALSLWLTDFRSFPNGKHDDAVDATAIMFHECSSTGSMALI